ncbi:hypothetical protein IJJ27_02355 [bacterium]|nr:hypothetical protein [bacterium]
MKKWQNTIKKWWWLAILLAWLWWYFVPFWQQAGLPVTHDGNNHLARFAQYYLAWRQGQLIPRLGPALENGYGYPVFNFNYPLCNLISLPLSLLRIDYLWQFKIITVGWMIVGLVGTYLWVRALSEDKHRFLPVIIWVLNPYLYSAIWFRGSIGELAAAALVPVVLWQIELLRRKNPHAHYGLPLALAAFFLSHNVMVLLLSPLIIIYAWWRLWEPSKKSWQEQLKKTWAVWSQKVTEKLHQKNWWQKITLVCRQKWLQMPQKRLWLGLGLAFLGLALSLWFWLPAMAEKHLTILDDAGANNEYSQHFVTEGQLLDIGVGGGLSFPGMIDGLHFGLGILNWWLLLMMGLRVMVNGYHEEKLSSEHKVVLVTVGLIGFCLWMQTAASNWLWQLVPVLRLVQFPWRYGLPASLLVVFLSVYAPTKTMKEKGFWLLWIVVSIVIFSDARPENYYTKTREDLLAYPESTSTQRENTAKTFRFDITRWPGNQTPVMLSGSGSLGEVARLQTSRKHYWVLCDDECTMVEQTADFAGFKTWVDGKLVPHVDSEEIGGRIAYRVGPGKHEVTTIFTERTWSRLLGDWLSLLSLIVVGWLAFAVIRQEKWYQKLIKRK